MKKLVLGREYVDMSGVIAPEEQSRRMGEVLRAMGNPAPKIGDTDETALEFMPLYAHDDGSDPTKYRYFSPPVDASDPTDLLNYQEYTFGDTYTEGCGITITGDVISVNTAAAADGGLAGIGLAPSGVDCVLDVLLKPDGGLSLDEDTNEIYVSQTGMGVTAGCGIDILLNVVSVNVAVLAGDGLTTNVDGGACELVVDYDCGLDIVGGQLVVKASDLAGDGLKTEGTCALAIDYENAYTGDCGITISAAGEIDVDRTDLYDVDAGLEDSAFSDCSFQVKEGCGILVDADGVNVLLQSPSGLECDPATGLRVDADCGLKLHADGLQVDADDLVGDSLSGLEEGSANECDIKVKAGTGILVDSEGVNFYAPEAAGDGLTAVGDHVLAVDLDFPIYTAGEGIEITDNVISFYAPEATDAHYSVAHVDDHNIKVNVGCGLHEDDANALGFDADYVAGGTESYLEKQDDCRLKVTRVPLGKVITDIVSADIEKVGSTITVTVKYKYRTNVVVLAADDETGPYDATGLFLTTTECP